MPLFLDFGSTIVSHVPQARLHQLRSLEEERGLVMGGLLDFFGTANDS
jgi:hypothetical protein